jgi:hypothetical protein
MATPLRWSKTPPAATPWTARYAFYLMDPTREEAKHFSQSDEPASTAVEIPTWLEGEKTVA